MNVKLQAVHGTYLNKLPTEGVLADLGCSTYYLWGGMHARDPYLGEKVVREKEYRSAIVNYEEENAAVYRNMVQQLQ